MLVNKLTLVNFQSISDISMCFLAFLGLSSIFLPLIGTSDSYSLFSLSNWLSWSLLWVSQCPPSSVVAPSVQVFVESLNATDFLPKRIQYFDQKWRMLLKQHKRCNSWDPKSIVIIKIKKFYLLSFQEDLFESSKAYVSKGLSDLKQNGTQEKKQFSGSVSDALPCGIICFVVTNWCLNYLLIGRYS